MYFFFSQFRPGTLSTNRGNDLLIKLLKFRYPQIIDSTTIPTLQLWLNADASEREKMIRKHEVVNSPCPSLLKQFIKENSDSFPMLIGQNWTEKQKSQMTIFLVSVDTKRT